MEFLDEDAKFIKLYEEKYNIADPAYENWCKSKKLVPHRLQTDLPKKAIKVILK